MFIFNLYINKDDKYYPKDVSPLFSFLIALNVSVLIVAIFIFDNL